MKANNFNLWFRLTVGSAIGAIVYHFSSGRKTEKLRKNGTYEKPDKRK